MISSLNNLNLDTSFIKVGILIGAGALFSGFFGWTLRSYFSVTDGSAIWIVILALASFLVVISLQPFFIKSNMIIAGAVALDSLAMTASFLDEFSILIILAFLLTALGLFSATKRGHQALENQLKIHFIRAEGAVIKQSITALAIFISLIYVNFLEFENGFIPKSSFAIMFKPAEPILERYFDNFSFEMTAVQLVDSLVTQQLKEQGIPATGEIKNSLIGESLAQFRKLGEGYGIYFKNNEKILDIFYNSALDWFNKIPAPFHLAVPIGFAILVFLTVKGFGTLIRWPISFLGYLLYELALLTGFAKLELESRSKEVIALI